MSELVYKVLKFLRSRAFSVVLLLILVCGSFLTQIIPQKPFLTYEKYIDWKYSYPLLSTLAAFLALDNILQSWWFKTCAILLFLSLLYCTYFRLKIRIGAPRFKWVNPRTIKTYPFQEKIVTKKNPETILQICREIISANFYQIKYTSKLFYADKGGINKYASMIYHAVMVLIFLFIALSRMSSLSGLIYITEGETLTEDHNSYSELYEGPWFNENHSRFRIELKDFSPMFREDTPVSYKSEVRVIDSEEKEFVLNMNKPVRYKGYSIKHIDYGFSPGFVLYRNGSQILNSYIAIQNDPEGKPTDQFVLNEDLKLNIKAFPDFVEIDGKLSSKSDLIKNPAAYVEILEKEKTVFTGILKLNEKKIADKYEIKLDGMRYWVSYNIGYDPYLIPLFFTGLLTVITISLALVLSNPRFLGYIYKKENQYVLLIGAKSGGKMGFEQDFDKIIENIIEKLR